MHNEEKKCKEARKLYQKYLEEATNKLNLNEHIVEVLIKKIGNSYRDS